MGDVVELRSDLERQRYIADVREVCRLAHMPEQADVYIRRGTPLEDVMSAAIRAVFGRSLPSDVARHIRRLTGPAGSRRRAIPKFFGVYRGDRS